MILEKDKIDWFTAMLQIMGREKGVKYMRELSRQNSHAADRAGR